VDTVFAEVILFYSCILVARLCVCVCSQTLESLCTSLYDALRPLIIHINHLETLAELCSILKVRRIVTVATVYLSACCCLRWPISKCWRPAKSRPHCLLLFVEWLHAV
jgi:hypothetical protein